jgi:hypothetical protein
LRELAASRLPIIIYFWIVVAQHLFAPADAGRLREQSPKRLQKAQRQLHAADLRRKSTRFDQLPHARDG